MTLALDLGPRRVVLILTCDACAHSESFDNRGGYIAQRADAMQRGWHERKSSGDREFICPGCAGARP